MVLDLRAIYQSPTNSAAHALPVKPAMLDRFLISASEALMAASSLADARSFAPEELARAAE